MAGDRRGRACDARKILYGLRQSASDEEIGTV
jgi:hypothetical protein